MVEEYHEYVQEYSVHGIEKGGRAGIGGDEPPRALPLIFK